MSERRRLVGLERHGFAGDRRRGDVVSIVQIERRAQLPLRELASRRVEAQHRGHRQFHSWSHLHTAFSDDRLGRRSKRRSDPGMAITVGEPADRNLLHWRQRHDPPIAPFECRWIDSDLDPPEGQLVTAALKLNGGLVNGREAMGNSEAIEVGGQPEPRVVGARRFKPLLGKEE